MSHPGQLFPQFESLFQMEKRYAEHTSIMERQYILMALKDTDTILQAYTIKKREGKFIITYSKRIPSRYWHRLYSYYCDFRDALNSEAKYSRDVRDVMELYIRVIPSLIQIPKVRKYKRFSKWRQFYYDYIKKFSEDCENYV